MQRRMERAGALWRGMDMSGAAALGRKALGWALAAGTMFLLCRARAGQAAPFAMAFLAAALLAGRVDLAARSTAALLAGCLAGALGFSARKRLPRAPWREVTNAQIVDGFNAVKERIECRF